MPVTRPDKCKPSSGSDLAILNFVADTDISEIVQEGVAHIFYWTHVGADEKFFDYVRSNDEDRIWSLTLLENLWRKYNVSSSLEKITETQNPVPTPEELDQLSDEEIEKMLTETRKLRAKNQIR